MDVRVMNVAVSGGQGRAPGGGGRCRLFIVVIRLSGMFVAPGVHVAMAARAMGLAAVAGLHTGCVFRGGGMGDGRELDGWE